MNSIFADQVCVTGTIGCGKSRVAKVLAEHCHLPYIDVDDVARDIMEPGGTGIQALRAYNGALCNDDGSLNRSLLRSEIFNSPVVRAEVDGLLHPLIQSALLKQLQGLGSKAVIEIPLLYETGWDAFFKTIIVVYAKKQTCIARIMERDQVSRADAEKAYGNQMDMELKKSMSPYVIDNDGPWATTIDNIRNIASKLTNM